MKKTVLGFSLLALLATSSLFAEETPVKTEVKKEEKAKKMTPKEVFTRMSFILEEEWQLSPVEKQIDTTGAHENKAMAHLVGTEETAVAYKMIGRGSTLQENLLTGTMKEMVTMYHCNSLSNCTELKATHYCAKKNQPEFVLNVDETTSDKFVFDCNMKTELCNSAEDHIHKMIFELSDEEDHLKSSYLAWKDKKLRKKHSIYHFDRK